MLTLSRELFQTFMRTVVIRGAFSAEERTLGTGPLAEKTARDIAAGRRIDHRVPYLCRVSGKGAVSAGTDSMRRLRFRNVSLLDHMVSVARGAAVFAELDLRACGIPEERIRPRISLLIAIGFLHDADKILARSRAEDLMPDDIAGLLSRYHVDAFLQDAGITVSAADIWSMIQEVEVSRAGSLRPGMRLLSAEETGDCQYVRLADRLDGIFLKTQPDPSLARIREHGQRREKWGIEGVVEELASFGGFRSQVFAGGWRPVRVRSPHTPFLLNQLQRGMSAAVQDMAQMPPLIEIHHDGEFLAIIPEEIADPAIAATIERATRRLRLPMRVMTNPKGTRDILDGGAGPADLRHVLEKNPREASKALFLHASLVADAAGLREPIDALLAPLGFPPNYGGLETFSGQHYQAWPSRDDDSPTMTAMRSEAAMIAIAMGCAEPEERSLAARVPDAATREAELVAVLAQSALPPPEWLLGMTHKLSRQTLLAALAAGVAEQDPECRERVLGEEGLLRLWLCGDGAERLGLLAKIPDAAVLMDAAAGWLRAAMTRRFLAGDESAEGRCHFTNLPVSLAGRIDTTSGLDGVNVSAFSGREGRPESFESSKAQTLVAAPAAAEHRLRTLLGEGRKGEVPAYVSSPTMMGLFASLNMRADDDSLQISPYDLMRQEKKPGRKVWPEAEIYGQRILFARHLSVPSRIMEAISLVRMMMQSALRLSRPVHVFQGLPVPENAYVHFDFLPDAVKRGLGGPSLRLEQVPDAVDFLHILEQLGGTSNLGLEVALRYADPATRFGAACEALAVLNRLPEEQQKRHGNLQFTLRDFTRSPDILMNQNDNVLIDFARAMTRVQAAPARDASNAERMLGLKVALAAVEGCAGAIHQTGTETLIAAIAGELENEFMRSSRLTWRGKDKELPFPRRAAHEAAIVFVEHVWPIAFRGRPPASKARRIAMAVYQVAFETESYRKRKETEETAAAPEKA